MKNEKIILTDIQIFAIICSIVSLVISLLLSYNEKLKLLNLKPILNDEEEYNVLLFDRIFILAIALVFLYINYRGYELSKDKKEKDFGILEIFASTLVIVASLIILYVVINSKDDGAGFISLENPTI
jgi:magnesium-transporting ATPase (P-type)